MEKKLELKLKIELLERENQFLKNLAGKLVEGMGWEIKEPFSDKEISVIFERFRKKLYYPTSLISEDDQKVMQLEHYLSFLNNWYGEGKAPGLTKPIEDEIAKIRDETWEEI